MKHSNREREKNNSKRTNSKYPKIFHLRISMSDCSTPFLSFHFQRAFGWNWNEFTRIASGVRLLLLDFIFDANQFTNIDTEKFIGRHRHATETVIYRWNDTFSQIFFSTLVDAPLSGQVRVHFVYGYDFFYCIIICGHRHRDYTPFLWIWPGIKLNQMLMHTLCTYCITKTVQIGRTIRVERDENKTQLCLNNDWPV